MVERQLIARGIVGNAVLDAMRRVPRERFVPRDLRELAYEDTPLPIAEEQTISQPFIVARMVEAAALDRGAKVLEIGTGSGYGAAVLAEIAAEVWTVERSSALAESAHELLADLGYGNVHVRHSDGTLGVAAEAPFDAIVVTAGGPDVPAELLAQLEIGGRLVIPVGPRGVQELLRIRKTEHGEERESLGQVRFVPLIGDGGWPASETEALAATRGSHPPAPIAGMIVAEANLIDDIEGVDLTPLLSRIGDARVVLLGEATHGTSEFYRMRARITRELILRKGFDVVAVEADWPDAARIDHYVRHREVPRSEWAAFARFPRWMWRNREVQRFVEWLRAYNGTVRDTSRRVAFHGLDLYSLYTSIGATLDYLGRVDPDAAALARERYACLTPFQSNPAAYGAAVLRGSYADCEQQTLSTLGSLLRKRLDYIAHDGDVYFDAAQNARLIANAEAYYREMYYAGPRSWNLRDRHMFETLEQILAHRGSASKIVVWEHNSHLGDARFTEMSTRGEINVGQLAREAFAADMYSVGFGTHTGTVAAASHWDGPMEIKEVRPSHRDSYEHVFHQTHTPGLLLPLRDASPGLRKRLLEPKLERAIGVIYRPQTELASHYFTACLPRQFDEYAWFDRTHEVVPLDTTTQPGQPNTYPFGL